MTDFGAEEIMEISIFLIWLPSYTPALVVIVY